MSLIDLSPEDVDARPAPVGSGPTAENQSRRRATALRGDFQAKSTAAAESHELEIQALKPQITAVEQFAEERI